MTTTDRFSGLTWTRSSHSYFNCLEAAVLPGGEVAVRDSKDTGREPLCFSARGWESFRTAVRTGGL
jgi:hypothetical protein